MARRKSLLDELAALPWPVPAVLGVAAFFYVRHVGGFLAPLAPAILLACWAAACVSFLNARKRRILLERQTGLDTIAAMDWREFEMLVGEAFRRQGYMVEETGLGGADGGIDLILHRQGRTELVQCKQWRSRQVRPAVVREMWGLVDHHHADGVKIVCIGDFTQEAAAFARGKAIELITGERLLAMVREVQTVTGGPAGHAASLPDAHSAPTCPACDSPMVRRRNRRTQQAFWGCTGYPRCRGNRPL
jgi:restriction system protein